MTDSIMIKNLELGSGIPKICVPLTSVSQASLYEEAETVKAVAPDLVEWRADFFEDLSNDARREETLKKLTEILDGIPLLFTIRTAAEGGQFALDLSDYVRIIEQTAKSHYADLIDVEIFGDEEEKKSLIRLLHAENQLCIGSSHDFAKTDDKETLLTRFRQIEASGADILKLAVMPQTFEDVTNLMNATRIMQAQTARPIISMSMSALGALTRYAGELYGSALTFATVTAASAPGQLPIATLRPLLQTVHSTQQYKR